MAENKNRLQVYVTDELKNDLNKMSEELGMTQSQLITMSLYSLVRRYDEEGSFIFTDILSPKKSNKKD